MSLNMDGVSVVNHPLIKHKLTIMRDKNTSSSSTTRIASNIYSSSNGTLGNQTSVTLPASAAYILSRPPNRLMVEFDKNKPSPIPSFCSRVEI